MYITHLNSVFVPIPPVPPCSFLLLVPFEQGDSQESFGLGQSGECCHSLQQVVEAHWRVALGRVITAGMLPVLTH